MLLTLEFQESYKRLDKLCKDCFASNDGVSEYIQQMDNQKWSGSRYVFTWDDDYRMLKHLRWVRNQLSHEVGTLQSDICTQDDLEYLENFYEKIIKSSDPLALLRKENERKKNQENKSKQTQNINYYQDISTTANMKTNKKSVFCKLWDKIKNIFFFKKPNSDKP